MSKEVMKKMGEYVQKLLPKDFGFALIVYKFKEAGVSNYISNGERSDMIKALREIADRLDKNQTFETPKDNIYGTE